MKTNHDLKLNEATFSAYRYPSLISMKTGGCQWAKKRHQTNQLDEQRTLKLTEKPAAGFALGNGHRSPEAAALGTPELTLNEMLLPPTSPTTRCAW
jgi:hypothetical protein